MELWLAFWFMCGIATAVIANGKGRDGLAWAGIGFVTGLFGLIMVIGLPRLANPASETMAPLCVPPPPSTVADVGWREAVITAAGLLVIVAAVWIALS